MSRHVVLLRAVNVGGTAKLPMARLREIATDLGAINVSTYIASGNLLVDLDTDHEVFDRALEQAITSEFGFFREVISRTPAQLRASLAAHPFEVAAPTASFVTFLTAEPPRSAVARAEEIATGEDRWQVIGAELHIRYAQGAGRPQMRTDAIMRQLGVLGTARNLNTVQRLIDLAGS
ncbi:DUF1697 domain-containing protein [Aeromicrobium sp. CF3.5]|uniref:DUF1697 domain-containing protein n=1 Tax=Aeromicrobium sp. CF3.5 TaxID=3373078 RepID=UPI003EE6FF95